MRRYLTIQNFETVYLKSVPQCDDMAHFLGGRHMAHKAITCDTLT